MVSIEERILEISHKYGLSHLGGCLTAAPIIESIYQKKKPDEIFVLSCGHVAMALYAVIERYEGIDAEKIFLHHGVHPDRCEECHISVSTGSLGNGLPIALGLALATDKNVYCLISDGECAEGSIWEALSMQQKYNVKNLKVYANLNGWGAYDQIDRGYLTDKLEAFGVETYNIFWTNNPPELAGQEGHYKVL